MNTIIQRRVFLPTLALLLTSYCLFGADGGFGPPGTIHFDDSQPTIDVQGILQIYKPMSGLELVVDSRAAQIHTRFLSHAKNTDQFTRAEALKLIEKNLLEDAGIVITHIDDKRVSVTYNDALPIKKQP